MEKRLRVLLAITLTFMMLMQSIAPIVTAQSDDPEASPVTDVDPNAGGNGEGEGEGGGDNVPPADNPGGSDNPDGNAPIDNPNGDSNPDGNGDPDGNAPVDQNQGAPADNPPADDVPPAAPQDVAVALAPLVADVDYTLTQAACGEVGSLDITSLIAGVDYSQIASVQIVDGNRVSLGNPYAANPAGDTVWVLITFADGFIFDVNATGDVDNQGWTTTDGGATAQAKFVFATQPTGVDCTTFVILPDPTTLVPAGWDGVSAIDLTAFNTPEFELTFVPADGDVVVDNTIEARFVDGYASDPANLSIGWSDDDNDGVLVAVVSPAAQMMTLGLPAAPMLLTIGGGGVTGVTHAPTVLANIGDPVRFDFTWAVTGSPTLQTGDSFTFDVANWNMTGIGEITSADPVLLINDNKEVIGTVTIDASGHGTAILNNLVDGKPSANGDFYFETDPDWAVTHQQTNDRTIDFDITADGNTYKLPVTIPGKGQDPEPEVPDPGTKPAKNGWFNTGDQGRTDPTGAIRWELKAPTGPAAGAQLEDIFIAEVGTGTWTFDCANLNIEYFNGATAGNTAVVCDPATGKVTVTFSAYGAGNPPGVRLDATITDPNNQPLPENGSLTFNNTVTSKVWKVGTDPTSDDPFGTGDASKSITQTGPVGATKPTKDRSWDTLDETKKTGSSTLDAPSRFKWTVHAPAGPNDEVTLTDIAPADWVFDCSTFRVVNTASWSGGAAASVSSNCDQATNTITVTFGRYLEPNAGRTPYFEVDAVQVKPQPASPREALTFKNTVTSETLPYKAPAGTAKIAGSAESEIEQSTPANPDTSLKKDGDFWRRDDGEYVPHAALKWTITAPKGPNLGVVITDDNEAGWKFVCNDANFPITSTDPQPTSIVCNDTGIVITWATGYSSGQPKITLYASPTIPFVDGQKFSNTAQVEVTDYLTDPNWNTKDNGTNTTQGTATQNKSQGGTGNVGEFIVSIGDYVWLDVDRDGMQEAGEPPVSGVKVTLFTSSGTPVGAPTFTDADGYYEFLDLQSDGKYYLVFEYPEFMPGPSSWAGSSIAGWTTTGGGDESLSHPSSPWITDDSNVVPGTGRAGRVDFTAPSMGRNQGKSDGVPTDNPTLDGGVVLLQKQPTIQTVQQFVEDNGYTDFATQNGPVVPIDSVVRDTATISGQYAQLAKSGSVTYELWYSQSVEAACTNGNVPVDAVKLPMTQSTWPIGADGVIPPSEAVTAANAGTYFWIVTVKSDDPNNKDVTSGCGEEWFKVNPTEPTLTTEMRDVDGKVIENGDAIMMGTVVRDTATLDDQSKNAGGTVTYKLYRSPSSAACTVDGKLPGDAVEISDPANPDTVTVTNGVIPPSKTWTVADGGTYFWIVEYSGDHSNGKALSGCGAEWFQAAVSIGDYIWLDVDREGDQDATEPPVAGVRVDLWAWDGTKYVDTGWTTTTGNDGYYEFLNLDPGREYQLRLTPPATMQDHASAGEWAGLPLDGWTVQFKAGGDTKKDSDVNPADGTIKAVAPTSGINQGGGFDKTDDPTFDAGLVLKKKTPTVTTTMKFAGDNGKTITNNQRVPVGSDVLDTGTVTDMFTTTGKATYSLYYSPSFAVCTVAGELPADAVLVAGPETVIVGIDGVIPASSAAKADKAGLYYWIVTFASDNPNNTSGESGCGQEYFQVPLVSIGDYVWFDDNFNGIQDEGPDRGVNGALVELFAADGVTKLGDYTTGADGYYYFADLQPDTDYVLKFTHNQDGYGWTKQNEGSNDEIDSDVDMAGVIAKVHTEKVGDNLTAPKKTDTPTYDAGIVKLVSVGDYVWFDYDRDGVQGTDLKEEPVEGVKVTLKRVDGSEPDRTTTTDANGYYNFKDLYPLADYELIFDKPENYDDWTKQNEGDDAKDSDVGADGKISFKAPTNVGAKNEIGPNKADNPTLDAGLVITKVSIGDYVWYDTNLDGQQGDPADEPPAKDITVTLFDKNGNKIGETKTDANGYYFFKDLEPETQYSVNFEKPENYGFTKQNAGDDASDSDADTNGNVTFTTPKYGKNQPWTNKGVPEPYVKDMADDPTIDAGLVKLVSMGDRVWIDYDRDGLQGDQAAEPGVPGVKVTLFDKDGNQVGAPTITDADGVYFFKDLYPDTEYKVRFELPTDPEGNTLIAGVNGWKFTKIVGNGILDADNSDANEEGWTSLFTTPKTGDNATAYNKTDVPQVDAGVIPVVSIGDYVWYDANRDGKQTPGETPIANVVVKITGPNGFTDQTTTDKNGYYFFKDLVPDTEYELEFDLPEGYTEWTTPGGGDTWNDPTTWKHDDSNVDPNGKATVTTPSSGKNLTDPGKTDNPTIDAGVVIKVSVGDYVWFDENRDGVQDPTEAPVSGVKVTLYDKDGNKVAETTTDNDGYYGFKDLYPDAPYSLVFEKPDGFAGWTGKEQGGDPTVDSNVDPDGKVTFTSPKTGKNELGPNKADNPTLDAGLIRLVSIGDYVWYDANKDGVQDPTEVPVAGVKVTLHKADGTVVGTTTTDADGYYSFKDLEPKTDYYLIFEKPDGFAGWTGKEQGGDPTMDSNVDPVTGRVDFTSPEKGNNLTDPNKADDPTLDGGLIRLVSIGDYVWYDTNGNGKQDPSEKPAKNIKVTLYDKDGKKVGETTTDETGYYYFKDLEPGTEYKLVFEKPAGYNWTQKGVGSNKEIDSDVNYLGEIVFTSPTSGNNLIGPNMTDNPTLDAGLVVIPEEPPVVEELPNTGSGTQSNSMIVLATLAGMVMAAGAVRLSVNKRS